MQGGVAGCAVLVVFILLVSATPGLCSLSSTSRRILNHDHPPKTNDTLYPHDFAGLLDGGPRLSCIKYFVLRQTAEECMQLTSTIPDVSGELCITPAGPLLAIYSPERQRNVFTARVTGPQVAMLALTSCSHTAREELTYKPKDCDTTDPEHHSVMYGIMSGYLPGTYHLNVTWLYTGFSYGKGLVAINEGVLQTMEAAVEVIPPTEAARAAAAALLPGYDDCVYCDSRRTTWPVCDPLTVTDGTWLLKNQEAVSGVLPSGLRHRHSPGTIHWQPKGCHFRATKHIDLRQCLAGKQICFVGDSHTRHLNNALVDALQHPAGPGDLDEIGKKAVLRDKACKFFWHPYGDAWVNKQLDKCTHVFYNFGQWPLSYQPPSRWSVSHYLKALQTQLSLIRAYKAKRQTSLEVYWVTTNYHTVESKHWNCSGLDFRTHPFVELYNEASTQLMRLHGIPVLDTALLSSHVSELTIDGSHFPFPGSVGHYVTEYLANLLCVKPGPRSHLSTTYSVGMR